MIHYIDRYGNTFKCSTKGQEADYQVIISRLRSKPTLVNAKMMTPKGKVYYKPLKLHSGLYNRIIKWLYKEALDIAKELNDLAVKMGNPPID